MSNVLLKIYPELNLGDDLFLKIILERYPEVYFYVLANKHRYKDFEKKFQNLHIIDRLENINVLDRLLLKFSKKLSVKKQGSIFRNFLKKQHGSILKNMDCFVTIGGSMFIEKSDSIFQSNVQYYKFINASLPNIPKFYLGCNFGPYYSNEFVDDFRNIFSEATDLSFRDVSSKDILKLPEIRINPDIVFGMHYQKNKRMSDAVGLVLVDPRVKMPNDKVDYTNYIDTISKLIRSLQEKGKVVSLFSFCKSEKDEDLINEIISLGIDKLQVVFYEGNIDGFLEEYSKMEFMVCGRFHSMILSMLHGQKILPLIYSEKMTNILSDVNFEGRTVNITNLNKASISEYLELLDTNEYNAKLVQKGAESHFEILDKYLNK